MTNAGKNAFREELLKKIAFLELNPKEAVLEAYRWEKRYEFFAAAVARTWKALEAQDPTMDAADRMELMWEGPGVLEAFGQDAEAVKWFRDLSYETQAELATEFPRMAGHRARR